MGSRSESEGEIIESENEEKATTALPSADDKSVNRKLRDALSPSPVPSPHSPATSTHSRSRDRSRSPYRAPRSPRGEKRRREDADPSDRSHTDSRRFRVRYEERGSYERDDRYDRTREDSGWRKSNAHHDERYRRERYRDKRRITRSRSPENFRGHGERHGRRDREHRDGNIDTRARAGRSNKRQSVEGQSDRLTQLSVSDKDATSSVGARDLRGDAKASPAPQGQDPRSLRDDERMKSGSISRTQSPPDNDNTDSQPAHTDETFSIEERRKRREAIKAKYKSQTNPLLVRALQPGNVSDFSSSKNGASTPRSEGSVSPPGSSPGTPNPESVPASPPSVNVSDDADLARTSIEHERPPGVDEASAADYDPRMDMREDRVRNDQRHHDEDMAADDYDETKDQDQDLLVPIPATETQEEPVSKKAKASDDMFASDDEDDDMFAPAAVQPSAASNANALEAVPVPQAKALDMSLLDNWDDHEGYYRIILGELLDGRYHVQTNLGKGMFSSVIRATDNKTGRLVAIKVIRNNESMLKAATKEMDILQKLADADPDDKKHVVRLERSFTHKGHLCMVFENLSINLREVLKKFGRDIGINLKAVRSYAQQMFLGLSLLRKCNILHADLKPDNILVNEARSSLKICDLGSAADASENDITPYLVSRFYRSPEIILGIPYDFAIDMWSIGCTLFELYTGKILFTGRTNNQMLRSIMECRGKFSLKMLKKAEFGAVHFDDQNLNFRSVERDKITGRDVTRLINFVKPTRDLKSRLIAAAGSGSNAGSKTLPEAELKEINLFADLLDRCLTLNPEKRITPTEALKHPFIHRQVSSSGSASK